MKGEAQPFDLVTTYVNLTPGGSARCTAGGAAFWAALSGDGEVEPDVILPEARLVCAFQMAEDWSSWEMHPAGDELVYVLSGEIQLVLEEPGGLRVVQLTEKTGVLVPRGVWHTANVSRPSEVLHVTPGAGTEHRPR